MAKPGRPPTKFGEYDQPRIIGRVSDNDWKVIKDGAKCTGEPLSKWAIDILLREARIAIASRKSNKNG
jgi:hypothetical protein